MRIIDPLVKEKFELADMHQDLAWNMISYLRPFSSNSPDFMLTESSYRKSGLRWAWCTIFTLPEFQTEGHFQKTIEVQFEIYRRLLTRFPGWLAPVRTKRELKALRDSQASIGISLLMEGAEPVKNPENLADFFARGVRALSLTWLNRNKYAGGNKSEGRLTADGAKLLDEAAVLGVAIDVSHLNKESYWDVIGYRNSKLPQLKIYASHSNAAAVFPSDRNLDDEQLSAMREAGGSVNIVLHNSYLEPGWIDTEYGIKKPLEPDELFVEGIEPEDLAENLVNSPIEGARLPDYKPEAVIQKEVGLEIVLEHIEHLVYMLGADKVGIGSDFDGGLTRFNTPAPFDDLTGLQLLGTAIEDKFGVECANGIMAGNMFDFWMDALPD